VSGGQNGTASVGDDVCRNDAEPRRTALANRIFRCFSIPVAGSTRKRQQVSDFRAEAKRIRLLVDRLIDEGKTKAFLVEHGFATTSGKLAKRYGG
jgi:hypothetical protein